MNLHPANEANSIVSDEANASDSMVRQVRQASFSATHLWIIATLWLMWTFIYMFLVFAHQRDGRSPDGSNAKRFSGLLPSSLFGSIDVGAANSHWRRVTAMELESAASDPENSPIADLADSVDAVVCFWNGVPWACHVLSTMR